MNWYFSALFSAISAALVAIFGKLGLKTIDSTLATTVRSVVMALFLIFVSLILGKFSGFSRAGISTHDWMLIILAGIAGAISWLFYFFALKTGPASAVSAIDRTSLVFVVLLAAVFLGEGLRWKTILGAILMVAGALLITLK